MEDAILIFDRVFSVVNAGWFGTLFGVISLGIALALRRRDKQFAGLSYLSSELEVIGPALTKQADALAVTFHGREVPRVTKASIGIWNSGTTTIHGRDTVADDPPTFQFPDGTEVLRVGMPALGRPANKPAAEIIDVNKIRVSFDYLDPKDGFRLEVIHTGPVNEITSSGTIRGVPDGLKRSELHAGKRRMHKVVGTLATIAGSVMVIATIVLMIRSVVVERSPESAAIVSFYLIVMVIVLLGMVYEARRGPQPARYKNVPDVVSDDPSLTRFHTS